MDRWTSRGHRLGPGEMFRHSILARDYQWPQRRINRMHTMQGTSPNATKHRRPPTIRVILARFEQFVAAHHCTKKIFFWSICLLLHYNQPPIIGTMPIRDIGELPYPHLLCWRAMKVNRSHSVRTNSILAINSSIVSQNYFNGSHLSPNNTRTCHQLICVDFVTKCRS